MPTATVEVEEVQLGRVRVTRWSTYHFRQAAQRPMTLIRVEVLATQDGNRRFTPLWRAWLGQTLLPLEPLWLRY